MLKRVLHTANQVVTYPETHTGRELSIERTVNDKVDLLKVTGDSWQFKQNQGKNLFNIDEIVMIDAIQRYGYIYDVPEGTYTISAQNRIPGDNDYLYASTIDSDGICGDVIYIVTPNNAKDATITISDSEKLIFYNASNAFTEQQTKATFDKYQFQLELGSSVTDHEPYKPPMPSPEYPAEIHSVNGKMVSNGWNLFNKETMVISNTTLEDDVFTRLPKIHDSIIGNKYWIPEPSQDYTIFVEILSDTQAGDLSVISDNRFYFENVSISLKKGKNYIHVRTRDSFENVTLGSLWLVGPKLDREIKFKLQILKGYVNDVPYDRYRASNISLPELRGITDTNGNVVAHDIIHVDRKQKRAWIERNVMRENVNANKCSIYNEENKSFLFILTKKTVPPQICPIITTHFKFVPYGYANPETYPCASSTSDGNLITFGTSFTTLEEFKEFVETNELYVQYMLADPIIEELPYTEHLLSTAQYQTNIRFTDINEHLQPEITATVKVMGR